MLLVGLLPARPRLVMLADGATAYGSWWRRLVVGAVGGVVPIWRGAGSAGFRAHTKAVRRTIDDGLVFSLFPETGRPARPPALRRLSPAVAYFSLRTGAPIVPIVFGGTDELFLRRRVVVRVLAPILPPALVPEIGSVEERDAARRLLAELRERVEPVAAELHARSLPQPGARRRWRWLTGPFPRPE